jgi:hypothetical protein
MKIEQNDKEIEKQIPFTILDADFSVLISHNHNVNPGKQKYIIAKKNKIVFIVR